MKLDLEILSITKFRIIIRGKMNLKQETKDQPNIWMCIKHSPHQCCTRSRYTSDKYQWHLSVVRIIVLIVSEYEFLNEHENRT